MTFTELFNRTSQHPKAMIGSLLFTTVMDTMENRGATEEDFKLALFTFVEAVLKTDVDREHLRELLAASHAENNNAFEAIKKEVRNGR